MGAEHEDDETSEDAQIDFSADESDVDSVSSEDSISTQNQGDDESGNDESDFSGGDLELEIDDVANDESAEQASPSKVPSWQCPPTALFHVASDGTQGDSNWQVYRDIPIMNAAADAEDSGPQIRLLKILPGSGDQPIHCALVRKPLYDTPDYQALSYSWGEDRQHSRSIFIESSDVEILVAAHLWKAIRRLRDTTHAVFVWVDAICIDQHNFIERAAQVGIMAQIYDQARQVAIWLGDVDDLLSQNSDNKYDANLFLALCVQPSPWWTRLWVLQECAYAVDCPVVLFGPASMTLKEFLDYWQAAMDEVLALQEQHKILQLNFDLAQTPYNIWQAQKERNEHRRPLLSRLRGTRDRQCSNGYDRVFALRSLVLEHEEEQLGSDYRESVITFIPKVRQIMQKHPEWRGQEDESLLFTLHPLAERLFAPDSSASRRYEALKELSLVGDHAAAKALLEVISQVSYAPWPVKVLRVAVRHHWTDITERLSQPSEVYGNPSEIYLDMLQSAAREDRQDDLLDLLELTGVFPFKDDLVLARMLSAASSASVYSQKLLGVADIICKPAMVRLIKDIQSPRKRPCGAISDVREATRSKEATVLKHLLKRMPLPSRGCYHDVIVKNLLSTDEECLKILLIASRQRQAEDRCPEHPWALEADSTRVVDTRDNGLLTVFNHLICSGDVSRDPMIYLLLREAPDLGKSDAILRSAVVEGRFDLLLHFRASTYPHSNVANGTPGGHGASELPPLLRDVGTDQLRKILAHSDVLGEAIVRAAATGRTADIKLLLPLCDKTRPSVDWLGHALVAACRGRHVEIVDLLAPHLALGIHPLRRETLLDERPRPHDPPSLHLSFFAACWHGFADAAHLILALAGNPQALREALPRDVYLEAFRQGHNRIAGLLLNERLSHSAHGPMLVQALAAVCLTSSTAHTRTARTFKLFAIHTATRYIASVEKENALVNKAENDLNRYAGFFRDCQLLLQEHPLDCTLFAACIANHPGLVTPLLDIAPRLLNGVGLHKCALLVLSYRGQIDLVRRMMASFGTAVLSLDRVNNATSIARLCGHADVALLLLAHGAQDGCVIENDLMREVENSCGIQAPMVADKGSPRLGLSQVWEEVEDRLRRERILIEDLLVISCYTNANGVDRLLSQLEICKNAPLVEEDLRAAFAAAALSRREGIIDLLQQRLTTS